MADADFHGVTMAPLTPADYLLGMAPGTGEDDADVGARRSSGMVYLAALIAAGARGAGSLAFTDPDWKATTIVPPASASLGFIALNHDDFSGMFPFHVGHWRARSPVTAGAGVTVAESLILHEYYVSRLPVRLRIGRGAGNVVMLAWSSGRSGAPSGDYEGFAL